MRELDHKESWGLKNRCFWTVVLEKTLENPLDSKEIKSVNCKGNQPWIFTGRTDGWSSNTFATWCEEPTHWKRSWCWERLRAGGEEGDRGWNDWMASPAQWAWVWVNFRRQWRTGKPAMLYTMGLQSETGLTDWTTTTKLKKEREKGQGGASVVSRGTSLGFTW